MNVVNNVNSGHKLRADTVPFAGKNWKFSGFENTLKTQGSALSSSKMTATHSYNNDIDD